MVGYDIGYADNNAAWEEMELPDDDTLIGENGEDITTAKAKTQATYTGLGWQFGTTDESPWKMGVGGYSLPVFYWQTTAPAAMPAHLK